MHHLAIKGGRIVSSQGAVDQTLLIDAGRIIAGLAPGEPYSAHEVIDATGMSVYPGLVDAHVHLRDPGLTHKEDFESGTAAAAAGGVTTVMVMPTDKPLTLTAPLFEEKRQLAQGRARVDFALQAGLGPDIAEVPGLAAAGAISFEIFMADFAAPLRLANAAELLHCLTAVARTGRIAGISAGDDSIVAAHSKPATQDPRASRQAFLDARPAVAEAAGLARALVLARTCDAAIHIRQVSSAMSVALLRGLRGVAAVSAEVTPHNLLLDAADVLQRGPVAKVLPPLRTEADRIALREALAAGLIDMVATDHAPHLPSEKAAGEIDLSKAPGGLAGLQTWLPLMLRMVSDGLMDEGTLVRACCEAPAQRFGLYPRKGSLQVGADADMVIIDLRRPSVIRNADQLSRAAQTPFDGWDVPGTLVTTLLRGQVIARDGRTLGSPRGEFLPGRTA